MSSQKDAVVAEVLLAIPTFRTSVDVASNLLSKDQLENIKANIMNGIINGNIDYSKDKNNHNEVRSYARSMTANHIKKAKELNGNNAYLPSSTRIPSNKVQAVASLRDIDTEILSDDLKEYIKSLK